MRTDLVLKVDQNHSFIMRSNFTFTTFARSQNNNKQKPHLLSHRRWRRRCQERGFAIAVVAPFSAGDIGGGMTVAAIGVVPSGGGSMLKIFVIGACSSRWTEEILNNPLR